ncbi:MAG TPA: hypothetical protein PLI41_01155 [Bacteroidales bacterium]|jgi:hypothetical protein|nr:hypothetical protein [Bacteroidales bacterium]HQB36126.1 hypothetical protein [Bacteroidales bacterium]
MKRHSFIIALIKSHPFRLLIIITLLIIIGVIIANRKEKAARLKENVLYVQPK